MGTPLLITNINTGSGSNQFEQVLAITGHFEPLTGPIVWFPPRHEPWTKPWSGSAGLRFELWLQTRHYHP